ncbi:MAG TPA: SusC/RagA family TonB-linked outer membrane protein [Cyclobacteriaceae bacterium]|nr:SusC/RagA family TonB-linked outer membrane protein [Cyclobacteriaceae bacterium]
MKRKLHCPRAVAKAVIKGVALTLLPFFAFAYSPMSPTSFGKYAKAHPISQLDVRVSGTVVGPNGEPIPGVTVSLEGASIGTATDLDGRYALTVPDGATLVFSFIGYVTQKVVVGNKTVIDITLVEDMAALEEIVVVGYGEINRGELTSSITSLSRENFNTGLIGSPEQLIQGKVPGINIARSGNPNQQPTVILRGPSTLRSGAAQQPLYIIDGVPGASIDLVAPDEITSIEVLKDASATAIYGARAANGVIMITTNKRGQRSGFSYNGYVASEQVSNKLDMLTGDELRSFLATNNMALGPNDDDGVNTDWQDEVMQTSISQNHTLSYSGSNESAVYDASINYFKNEGIIKTTANQRTTGKINYEQYLLNDRLRLGFTLFNSIRKQNYFPNTVTGNRSFTELFFGNMLQYLPTVSPYREDGSFKENLVDNTTSYFNPLALLLQNKEESTTTTILANPRLYFEPIDNLSYTLSISYQNMDVTTGQYLDRGSQVVQGFDGYGARTSTKNIKKILENFVTYNFTTGIHGVKLMAGYSWQEDELNDSFMSSNQGFISDALGYYNLGIGNFNRSNYSTATLNTLRLISFYGRVNYSLGEDFYLQGSLRRDGSSAFGANNRWGTFPGISAMYRLSNLGGLQQSSFLEDLRLRAGYGVTGNSLGFNPLIARMRFGNVGTFYDNGNFVRAIGPTQNANPDLKWESTAMLNIGLDFSFMEGRLGGSIEYYDKQTRDLIWEYQVSTTKYLAPLLIANAGEISNKGIEIMLNASPVRSSSFQWDLMGTFSTNKNEVTKLTNENLPLGYLNTAAPGGTGQSGINTQRVAEGYPIGQFYTLEFAGRDESGMSQYRKPDGSLTTSPTTDDHVYLGNAQPKLLYGLNSSMSWKNFDLNMFFRGVYGNTILNAQLADLNRPFNASLSNLPRFSMDEPITDGNVSRYSSRYLESGSYFRFDNATLGYSFPTRSNNVKKIRLYLNAQNLFIITDYRGIDPEMEIGGLTPGIDMKNYYPKTRSFLLGLNLNF